MKAARALQWTLTGVAVMSLIACHRTEVAVEAGQQPEQQPVYVEQQAPPPVVVQQAPPEMIVETPPPQPVGGVSVWVGGYWHWGGARYVWVKGRWAHPPRAGVVWVGPRYERFERGYHYVPGYWRGERR